MRTPVLTEIRKREALGPPFSFVAICTRLQIGSHGSLKLPAELVECRLQLPNRLLLFFNRLLKPLQPLVPLCDQCPYRVLRNALRSTLLRSSAQQMLIADNTPESSGFFRSGTRRLSHPPLTAHFPSAQHREITDRRQASRP
jgi:hypothetical protein